jgi:hypothetical protein
MPFLRHALLLAAALLASAAGAQQSAPATSEARDTATAAIGSWNFVVRRLSDECLAMVGRSESPQQYVAQWQQRNARYVMASARYMEKRLEEAAASGGPEKRDAVLRDLKAAVQSNGESVVRSWLQAGRKGEACMHVITLLDTGVLDISPKLPMYAEIEALVRWAEQ